MSTPNLERKKYLLYTTVKNGNATLYNVYATREQAEHNADLMLMSYSQVVETEILEVEEDE